MITRRSFLRQAGGAVAGAVYAPSIFAIQASGEILDPATLTPFADPLPIPKRAESVGTRQDPENTERMVPFFKMAMRATNIQVHRDLPSTTMWGFNGSFPGPTFEARSSEPLLVEWANELPERHFLPIDFNLHGAGRDVPKVRSVIHLHGGRTPPQCDGYPEDWYTPGKSATYRYPNGQDAALLFYHDHAMGINRLNIYAGLLGLFIVRDAHEGSLNLPGGDREIPLVLCDRFFRKDGRLFYPVSGIPGAPWVPEVFGNAVLVNGKLLPYLNVEPTLYRLRILNGSNSRFYRLTLDNGLPLNVIGSDQGLLNAPVEAKRFVLAPAERADVLVDFGRSVGKNILLSSDSLQIMQFRVGRRTHAAAGPMPRLLQTVERVDPSQAVRTRRLTLDEKINFADQSGGMLLNGTPWSAPVTENPVLHTTEIWELLNLTQDSHPIHLHLVRFQILDRRPFDTAEYLDRHTVRYLGPAVPPQPEEAGWKDTIRADPGMVTRIVVPFNGYSGRYVWHCHVLEHEDNEMMRPYEILPVAPSADSKVS